MLTSDFDFYLPPELIAQSPSEERDGCRLLVLRRSDAAIEHRFFGDILEFLRPGDLLVLNDSRVIPARLRGRNALTDGRFELLLVEENSPNDWWVLLRPGKRARAGTRIQLLNLEGQATGVSATVTEVNEEGHRRVQFLGPGNILEHLEAIGEVPLPPYIARESQACRAEDLRNYQTVYASPPGSVAAPTAGLHFTPRILEQLQARGVRLAWLTLHVGLGTFAPVKVEQVTRHRMHEERYVLPETTAAMVNETKASGGRVVAVGTTSARVLESAAAAPCGRLRAGSGRTDIFIFPPCQFRVVDALLTNFHLPRSTLLMLVSAFAAPGETRGVGMIRSAYREAVRERYRFFSFGDAMLIL
jgi:S-adenosylmethionine:tRNA ribosyltransferase-isomerase